MAQLLKSLPAMRETWVSSPGREDPWRREGQPASVFFLESPRDRGAWRAAVHGATESQTRLSNTHGSLSEVFKTPVSPSIR